MIVSRASGALPLFALSTLVLLTSVVTGPRVGLASDTHVSRVMASGAFLLAQAQTNDAGTQALPSVNVGPSPTAVAPPPAATPSSDRPAASDRVPRSFQLRIDPRTGQPVAAERAGSGPTPLIRGQEQSTQGAGAQVGQTQPIDASDPGRIRVETLQAVDPESVGILSEGDGGFGLGMWQGSTRQRVARLLPLLPVGVDSPQMHALMRRLLLSTAIAPSGDANVNVFALRVRRLAAAGHHTEALGLLEQAAVREIGPDLAAVRLDALLLLGSIKEACSLVRNRIAEADVPLWQKATAFCLAVDGEQAQVELYEQLLYENGIEDPAFFTMLAGLSGRPDARISSLPNATPLHLAMLRAGQWPVPEDAANNAEPSVLRAIASASNVSPELRLLAAERATARGLQDAASLRRIYAATDVPDATADNAAAIADDLPGPIATALLFKTALSLPGEEARAGLIADMLQMARKRGRYMPVAQAAGALIASIEPTEQLSWFAAEAGRALLLAGEPAQARQWLLAMLEPARRRDPDAAQAVLTLSPLVLIGDYEARIPIVEDALTGWWRGEEAGQSPDRRRRAGLFFYLAEAFDQPVPGALWEEVMTDSGATAELPAPGVRVALDRASGNARIGETVLLSLVALGEGGPAAAEEEMMARVVRALRRLGLDKEARALALEALIARGF